MRLVIRKNLAQQIADEIDSALREDLEVERVELSRAEWAELARCPQGATPNDPLAQRSLVVTDGEFFVSNVPVVLEGSVKRAERVLETT